MLFDSSYRTIETVYEGQFRDRGSRFIAIAFPVKSETEFKKKYNELKKLHHKANHHCYAMRLTPDRSVLKFSDDREPAGTAGRPILNTLLSHDVTDCAIVVVRYFGGTLLGVTGLINAYKSAAEAAIANAVIAEKEIKEYYQLRFVPEHMNGVMQLLKQHHATIQSNEFDSLNVIKIEIAKHKADELIAALKNHHQLHNTEITATTKV